MDLTTCTAADFVRRVHGEAFCNFAENMMVEGEMRGDSYVKAVYARMSRAIEMGYITMSGLDCYTMTDKADLYVSLRAEELLDEYEPPTCPVCDAYGCGNAATGAPCRQFEDRSRY